MDDTCTARISDRAIEQGLPRFCDRFGSPIHEYEPAAQRAHRVFGPYALEWSCTGTNTAAPGRSSAATTARIEGVVALRIGRSVVPTVHELQRITLKGGQRGSIIEDWWFTAASGLPVRMDRHITIKSSSPIGTITYREAGSWQITSLQPRT